MNQVLGVVMVLAAGSWSLAVGRAETIAAPKGFGSQFKQTAASAGGGSKSAQLDAQFVGLSRVPKFGFSSSFGFAHGVLGEHITEVRLGSAADRMGLAVGDVILAVNGQPLRNAESWYEAVQKAGERDGWVTLKILERRTGATAYRTANLFKLNAPRP